MPADRPTTTPKTYCPECGGPSTWGTPVGALFPKEIQLHTAECSRWKLERERSS